MHYVVTGGAGFIGSNIVRELAGHCSVTIFDNLSNGNFKCINSYLEEKNVKFIRGDIRNLDELKKTFKSADGVFHGAAQISVQDSIENPICTDEINTRGTLNVLKAAVDCDVKKVVFASSAAVYGDNPVLPKKEDMLPSPMSPYAVSKLTGEYYCSVFSEIYGLETACLRYFNVFGPGQDPNSPYAAVIPKFINAIIKGNSPVIYGDGNQTRDFIYVRDVAQANIIAMNSSASGIFNIASSQSLSLNQLLEILKEIAQSPVEPVFEAGKVGDIRHSVADISKAKETFNFSPLYSLKEGLIETYLSFINELE